MNLFGVVVCVNLCGIIFFVQSGEESALNLYKNLFKVKRKDHITALEYILLMESEEKQGNVIKAMVTKISQTVEKALLDLDQHGYKANDTFPTEPTVKDALSLALENTAFMTDLLVRFPLIIGRLIKKERTGLQQTFSKARYICEGSGVFVGEYAVILHSLGQELGLDKKDENYKNPFREKPKEIIESSEERKQRHKEQKKNEKRAKKNKGGPKMTKTEL